uniref:Uncharacterized protein LOC113793650 n=1 Tax=Dermatophagoides pteronyssinus TaxID=6956 RepID=A0A6P6Y503_DERPT|nr:uncharacterized protein LOC113793650 [Dermatophagoides pteronyssinus]
MVKLQQSTMPTTTTESTTTLPIGLIMNSEKPQSQKRSSSSAINVVDYYDHEDDQKESFSLVQYLLSSCGLQHLSTMKHLDSLDILYAVGSLIAFLGCVWQLIDVSRIYFAYDTNVNVMFEREVKVEIPGITVCANLGMIANEDYLLEHYRSRLESMSEYPERKYRAYKKLLRNLTLDEQLNKATISHKQLFHECRIMTPIAFENSTENKDGFMPCNHVAPIHEFLTYSKKCFSIGLQLNDEPNDRYIIDHDATVRDNGFPLFEIRLLNKYLEAPVIFINSRTTPFLSFIGGQTNGFHVNNTKFVTHTFSYVKTITELLEPPFKTRCRKYEEIGYKSLMHCMNHCKANYFIRKFNGWHGDVPADNNYNLNIYYAPEVHKQNKSLDKIMSEECSEFCSKRQDCKSEFFTVQPIAEFERGHGRPEWQNLYRINIYLPSGLNTHYKHSPRLEWIEFICYYASVISLWFGFSIIAFSRALVCLIHQNSLAAKKNAENNNSLKADIKDGQTNGGFNQTPRTSISISS